MADNLVQRAQWGDLEGMNIAGLVRLSFELAGSDRSSGPFLTGRDIKGRDEQAKDCRTYVDTRKGNYVYTYEDFDTR
jgi:site-specific DNA recombinase